MDSELSRSHPRAAGIFQHAARLDVKRRELEGLGTAKLVNITAEGDTLNTTLPEKRQHTLPRDSATRKEYPIYSGVIRYFPAALAEVARVSKIGNDKHNQGQEMHHARGKSLDHADCQVRHMIDAAEAGGRDADGVPELAYKAWRALAELQEWLEKNDGAPLAPGAKLPEAPYNTLGKEIQGYK